MWVFMWKLLKHIWKKEEKPSFVKQFVSHALVNPYLIEDEAISLYEVEFLNHIEIETCPHCQKKRIIKYGKYKNGIQRYQCKKCHKIFYPLSKTIFDSKKKSLVKWIHYLVYLFSSCSNERNLKNCLNIRSTEKYWLMKIFKVLKNCQKDIILEDNVCFKIVPFLEIESNQYTNRKSKKQEEKKDKMGVILAIDNHQHFFFKVIRLRSSVDCIWVATKNHIRRFSKIIYSEERYCKGLICRLHLKSKVYKKEKLNGKVNPIYKVLYLKSLLGIFLKEHQGKYDIDNLQDWMNLFWFIISSSDDMADKIVEFINLSLITHRKMKYRDIMRKSHF